MVYASDGGTHDDQKDPGDYNFDGLVQDCSNSIYPRQRAHDARITSLLRQNDVPTSYWRQNDVIITSCARWVSEWHVDKCVNTILL